MSSSETSDYGNRTDGAWSTAKRFGKVLSLAILGLVLLGFAGYVHFNPVTDSSWVAGIGFYELAPAVTGAVLFYVAYSSIQGASQAESGGY